MLLSLCDNRITRKARIIINYRMQFDSALGGAEPGPVKKGQAQGYDTGIHDENLAFQTVRVEPSPLQRRL